MTSCIKYLMSNLFSSARLKKKHSCFHVPEVESPYMVCQIFYILLQIIGLADTVVYNTQDNNNNKLNFASIVGY